MVNKFKKEDIGKLVSLEVDPKEYGVFSELEEKAISLFFSGKIIKLGEDHIEVILGYYGSNILVPRGHQIVEIPYSAVRSYSFLKQ